jgi:hypothetical protein
MWQLVYNKQTEAILTSLRSKQKWGRGKMGKAKSCASSLPTLISPRTGGSSSHQKKKKKTRATFSFMHPPCSWLTSQPASNPTAEADLLSMSVQVYRNRAVLCVAQAGEFTATFLSSSMHLSDQPANNPPAGRTSEHVSMQCSAVQVRDVSFSLARSIGGAHGMQKDPWITTYFRALLRLVA